MIVGAKEGERSAPPPHLPPSSSLRLLFALSFVMLSSLLLPILALAGSVAAELQIVRPSTASWWVANSVSVPSSLPVRSSPFSASLDELPASRMTPAGALTSPLPLVLPLRQMNTV